ncbi:NUDIX domain-containing protein [Pedobacter mucosus]|uniref:NUDIX domain-containing protein n=1 Tax=Pedobacter mucosus TaxID=2895286 RepID=UPI001EE476E7|nr:NUDIX domain-containing protein [Pedobacter mucosus]UKT62615.1 NUDIX domain-containing protein [Pedobacter mucosus]
MKLSAGILLFKKFDEGLAFFLVHPGGPFFARKDAGFWTIPKGELFTNEKPLDAAIREFNEEIGFTPEGEFIELDAITQKGGKKVLCWAIEGDFDISNLVSNTFEIEWPPKSGKKKSYPEVDKAIWANYEEAILLINERQISFLDQLILKLSSSQI